MEAIIGQLGVSYIEGMTNSFGDDHPEPYVRQVSQAAEGVRLIKLSDLADNCTNVTYTLFALGTKWAEEYFLPIVRPMIAAVLPTEFSKYPRTSEKLKTQVAASYAILLAEVDRFKAEGK
jgi:hypothetical protein